MGRWKNSLSKRSYPVAVQTEPLCLPWFLQGSYENPTREMLQKLWNILRHSCHINLLNLGKLCTAHTGQDYKRKKIIICLYLEIQVASSELFQMVTKGDPTLHSFSIIYFKGVYELSLQLTTLSCGLFHFLPSNRYSLYHQQNASSFAAWFIFCSFLLPIIYAS